MDVVAVERSQRINVGLGGCVCIHGTSQTPMHGLNKHSPITATSYSIARRRWNSASVCVIASARAFQLRSRHQSFQVTTHADQVSEGDFRSSGKIFWNRSA